MTILESSVSPSSGTSLIAPEIVEALSQDGIVDYWVETKGLYRPKLRRLHLIREAPYDPVRDGTIETDPGMEGLVKVRKCCRTDLNKPHNINCPYRNRR